MQLFDLTGKNVLIIGGTRGTGFTIARRVKRAGDGVWIHDSSEDRTRRITEENGFDYLYGDLRDQERLDGMLRPFLSREDRSDVLINNAGSETHSATGNTEEESMGAIYNVNTRSSYFLLQRLLPASERAGRTSVINMTPTHQRVPVQENGYHCTAKASLGMFTKVVASELAKYGIHVNNLASGAILTDINCELVEAMDFEKWVPMGRVGRTNGLISPAVFLASDASSYITGTTLYMGGGYSGNLLWY